MLDEVEVESSFDEDEIKNVFQFDIEGEEDNIEVNEYYPDYVLKSCFLFSIFVLLTRRKATEALIHRVGNYPDLLPEIPRYCCPLAT